MRDVDQDFVSYIVSRKDAGIKSMKDLEHKRLAVGTHGIIKSPHIMRFVSIRLTNYNLNL
jgi:TRAP-type uncharacterized transport system substrate-binding protein